MKILEELSANTNVANQNTYTSTKNIMIMIVIASILLSISLGAAISLLLKRQINRALIFAQKLGEGDLTHKLHNPSKDELGLLIQSLNKSNENIRNLISEININTGELKRID